MFTTQSTLTVIFTVSLWYHQWRSQDLVSGGAQPDFPLLSSFSPPSLLSHPPFSPLRTISPSLCSAVFLCQDCHLSPTLNSARESGAALCAPPAGPGGAAEQFLCILRQNRILSWHEHEDRSDYGLHFPVNWTCFILFIVCKNFVVRFRWGPRSGPLPPPSPRWLRHWISHQQSTFV